MIRHDLTNREYHAHPAISASDIKTAHLKSIAHWRHGVRKESTAFDLGTAVHAMVLEPEKELVRRGPADRRGDKWKHAKMAADFDDILLLPEAEYDLAEVIAQSVIAHTPAWLDVPRTVEASIFASDPITGVDIKCRPDIYIEADGLIVDLKTCASASPRIFTRDVHAYGYNLQAAFYLRTLRAAGLPAERFLFLAAEKEPPYAVCLHEIDPDYLDTSDAIITKTLLAIRDATEKGLYTTGWPEVNVIARPAWISADEPDDLDF